MTFEGNIIANAAQSDTTTGVILICAFFALWFLKASKL